MRESSVICLATGSHKQFARLVTLFNASPAPAPSEQADVPLQLTILLRLASLGASHPDDLSLVAPSLLRLPSYLSTWSLASSPTGASAVEKVASVLSQNDRPSDAFALVLDYLRIPGAVADPVAATAVKLALTSPDFFDWRAVESIEPVKSYLSSNPSGTHAQLLRALDDGNVSQVEKVLAGSDGFDGREKETVVKKAKLLSLAELCGKRVGGQVTYEEVAEALGLQGSIEDDDGMQVEEWIINGPPFSPFRMIPGGAHTWVRDAAIKAHLISARVHQPTRLISVTTATSRSFGQQQWTQLLSRLRTWSSSLDSLVASVEKSLPAGAKAGATAGGKEQTLEEKEKEARAGKEQVVGQVKSEVETVA